jgi:hypothetical protein
MSSVSSGTCTVISCLVQSRRPVMAGPCSSMLWLRSRVTMCSHSSPMIQSSRPLAKARFRGSGSGPAGRSRNGPSRSSSVTWTDRYSCVRSLVELRLSMGDADGDHGCPPCGNRDEIGAVRSDVLAQPTACLVQAGLGRTRRFADQPGREVGVVVKLEPVRVAQPVQGRERLRERLLHDVVHVAGMRAQPCRTSPRPRRVPFDKQPERGGVTRAGEPDQVAVRYRHTG